MGKYLEGKQLEEFLLKNLLYRFWSKVDKNVEDNCWDWKGTIQSIGYGMFRHKGRMRLSHRIAYELTHGQIPEGLNVLHTCDNRKCCNPKHLFLGTQKENILDMYKKDRNRTSDLNKEIVREIFQSEGTQHEIAERYGISQQQVSRIKRKENWSCLLEEN